MTARGVDRSPHDAETASRRLDRHLADLVDRLPVPHHTSPHHDTLNDAARTVVADLVDHPAVSAEPNLQPPSHLNCLQWALARRHAVQRGWVQVLPSRTGHVLLAPTSTGRGILGGNRPATRLETLISQYGQRAELIADLQDHLAPTFDRWIADSSGILDALVVLTGRGTAIIGVHPARAPHTWATVFNRADALGAAVVGLAAWPEHHDILNRAQHAANHELIGHPARLTLSLQTTTLSINPTIDTSASRERRQRND